MSRESKITRKTAETDISLSLCLDGSGESRVQTGIGFMDHMLTLFSRHGLFNLEATAAGDLQVDAHHTVEDLGIVLGMALKEALGDKKGIRRYGTAFVPMDEALAMVSLDLSGRAFLVFDCPFSTQRLGELDTELAEEFFRAIASQGGVTLHIRVLYGKNNHHILEAVFKAFGRALDEATRTDERIDGVMSTKGILE